MRRHMNVREAGYRERVALKAYLYERGRAAEWPECLDSWGYDPHRDLLIGPRGGVYVAQEGSASCAILRRYGADDSGCSDA